MLDGYSSPSMPSPSQAAMTGGNILIVDDTPENLLFLATLLTDAGYSVRKVISGQMAISAAQAEVPDLVLLDIVMPGMSGYEVCELLKKNEITRDAPIIFLSALDEELDKVQAFKIGGVDYITKPFQVVEVLARIETHLKIRRLQAQLQQQNARLQQEIDSRAAAESAVARLNQGIEEQVQERLNLLKANQSDQLQPAAPETASVEEQEQHSVKQQRALAAELEASATAIQIAIRRLLEFPRSRQDNRHIAVIREAAQRIIKLLE